MDMVNQKSLKAGFIAFLLSPLVPVLFHVLASWGSLLLPVLFLELLISYFFVLLFFVPIFSLIVCRGRDGFYIVSFSAAFIFFVLFLVFFIISGQGYGSLIVGGDVLVSEGNITLAGYKRILKEAVFISILAGGGGWIFYKIYKIFS